MSWDGEKQVFELKEKVQEKSSPESIHLHENIEEDKRLSKLRKYSTIFNCRYTEIKE